MIVILMLILTYAVVRRLRLGKPEEELERLPPTATKRFKHWILCKTELPLGARGYPSVAAIVCRTITG